MSARQVLNKWLTDNDANGITTGIGLERVARLFLKMHPDMDVTYTTVRGYVSDSRSGKITNFDRDLEHVEKALLGDEAVGEADFNDPLGLMPDGRYLRDEIEVGRSFVKSLRKLFPNIPIYWKDGNHEKRLEAYVASKAPELVKLFGMNIPTQLELEEHGIIHVPEHKVAKFGKLWIAHGHELGLKSGTVNIARQVRMRVGVNVMFGHWHKNQQDSSRNLADEVHSAWAIGCLAYLKPRYTGVLNQWTQGGATVDLHEDGSFTVNSFQIVDGVVI